MTAFHHTSLASGHENVSKTRKVPHGLIRVYSRSFLRVLERRLIWTRFCAKVQGLSLTAPTISLSVIPDHSTQLSTFDTKPLSIDFLHKPLDTSHSFLVPSIT